jgi:hypothetical protein
VTLSFVIAVDDKDGRFVTLTRTNGAWQFAYDVGKRGGVLSAFVDRATTTLMEAWGMVLPQGQTPANNPIQVFWFYVKDKKQGSTLYVKGDSETAASVVRNCFIQGVANPAKCVNSKNVLSNGDRQFVQLWRDGGDPGGGKR